MQEQLNPMISFAKVRRFLQDEDGPTSLEYAVLLMVVIAVAISGIQLVSGNVSDSWNDSAEKINRSIGGRI
jgi:pilus assembly protein Flp/PilA